MANSGGGRMLKFRDINKDKYILPNNKSILGWCERNLPITLPEYQKEILKDQSRLVIGHWGRRTGKSTICAVQAVYAAAIQNKDVVVVTHNREGAECFTHYASNLAVRTNTAYNLVIRHDALHFHNGSKILVVPYQGLLRSVCGVSADLVIIDEFHFIKSDVLDVVIPLIASNGNSRLLMLSTASREPGYSELIDKNQSSYYRHGAIFEGVN